MHKAIAEEMVDRIIEDLSDRKGLQNEWENVDAVIRAEIKEEWRDIIMAVSASHQ